MTRVGVPSVERSGALASLARLVMIARPVGAANDAAAICERALAELLSLPTPYPPLVAVLRANFESCRRVAGHDNLDAFARAIGELRALYPEPWIKAGLLAHAASLGAALGFPSTEAALDQARRELWHCTLDCDSEWAPRLLYFAASAGFYELIVRLSGGLAPLVRGGIAGHGVPFFGGAPSAPEVCGHDTLLFLSTAGLGALLERDQIELVLELAAHVTDGRLVSPALLALRESLRG